MLCLHPSRSLRSREAREQIQTAGPGLRKGLQRSVFRSVRVRTQLVARTAHKTEMDCAPTLWISMGGLQQRAVAKLDDADAGVDTRGEPEPVKQGDHFATNGHCAREFWAR